MGILVDVTPLRAVPAFRRYFFGQLVSIVGSMFTVVAMRYQAYKLGHDSTFAVSLLAVITLVPLLASSMIGGSIADAWDKRAILRVTQVGLALCSLALYLNAASRRPHLGVLFGLAALSSALVGIDWPTRSSLVPGLVGPVHLHGAVAINIAMFNIGGIAGPLVAGWFVTSHLPLMYLLDASTFVMMLFVVSSLPRQPGREGAARPGFGSVADGFRYLRTQRTIRSTFAADLGAMIFGLPDALFPAMAEHTFGSARWIGALTAAPAVGAVVGGMFNGWTARIRRQGVAVIWCIVVWGLGIALFGATRWLPVALLGLGVAGAADAVSATFRTLVVQTNVPEEFRGRLSAIFIAVVRGGPRLGEFESGIAASFGGLQFAAVSGGLACIVWIALVARRYPELAAYVAPERPSADGNGLRDGSGVRDGSDVPDAADAAGALDGAAPPS